MNAILLYARTAPVIATIMAAVILFTPLVAEAEPEHSYIRMSEYLNQHPGQAGITEAFAEQVRGDGTPLTAKQEAPVRIAVIYPALQASDYWRRSVSSFEARLAALGISYDLKTFYSRPSVDLQLQSMQLNQALSWQPDYLVFTLDTLKHRRMIESILARGKPKLILQNITTPLRRWELHRPFLYVGFDHAMGTRMIADYMLDTQQHQGNYLLLYFSHGYVSAMRGDTFASVTASHPAISQIASYYTDGDRQRAHDATLHTLSGVKRPDFIFASATDIALGAADALDSQGLRGKIMLNGWGGGAEELKALREGALDVTVMRMNDDNGVAMAEAIKLDLEGSPERVPHIFSGDIKLITKDSAPDQIEALKARAFRYSGQQ